MEWGLEESRNKYLLPASALHYIFGKNDVRDAGNNAAHSVTLEMKQDAVGPSRKLALEWFLYCLLKQDIRVAWRHLARMGALLARRACRTSISVCFIMKDDEVRSKIFSR